MANFAKPWFRKNRGWFVTLGGRQVPLGADKDQAFQRYHQLMAAGPAPTKAPSDSVLAVLERYLQWCSEHRAQETYEWYRWRLQLFIESIDKKLLASQLKHFHIDEWLLKRPDWSPGTKHGMARAVMRAFRWAAKKGYIDRDPIADYEKARPGKRNVVISSETFNEMLSFGGCQEFDDLLIFTWETAARPQESLIAEARHVDFHNSRMVFPPDEAKGEQWPRILYLTEKALEIIRRLVLKFPTGPLFRNSEGQPWTTEAVNCGFSRLQIKMGMKRLIQLGLMPKRAKKGTASPERRKAFLKLAKQHAPKYCLYTLRHSWATHALSKGIDALTVAILLGHRDPSTLAKVYQHLSQSPEYLREQARRAGA
jgi:integrase